MHDDAMVHAGGGILRDDREDQFPAVVAADAQLVAQLGRALPQRAPIGHGHLARRAAMAAVALATGDRRPLPVAPAEWLALAVRVSAADWRGPCDVCQDQEALQPVAMAVAERVEAAARALPPGPAAPVAEATHEQPDEQFWAPIARPPYPPPAREAAAADPAPVPVEQSAGHGFSFRPGERSLDVPPARDPVPLPVSNTNVPAVAEAEGTARAVGEDETPVVSGPTVDALAALRAAAMRQPAAAVSGQVFAVGAVAGEAGHAGGRRGRREIGGYVRTALRWGGLALAGWFAVMLVLIVLFRFVDPPGTPLMAWQALGGTKIDQRWVPLSKISPNLARAVIVSEDGRFCGHWGIDPREVVAAIRRARNGVPRGASTITMQVAKNLFLWSSKSYVRKALEVPLALSLEVFWPKRRILEVYLNIAEWGPGVFGAEAAARHHFKKPAARLSRGEAALLAVSLPNPIRRDAGDPGRGTAQLARTILLRMRVSSSAAACVLPSR